MPASQPVRTICVPQVIVCDGSEDDRAAARNLSDTIARIMVFPTRREVMAFFEGSAITFQCASLLVVSDVIVELGFCANTSETRDYLMGPTVPHIMEKSLNGMGVSIRPLTD